MRRGRLVAGLILFLLGRALPAIEAQQDLPSMGLAEIQSSRGLFLYIDFWASWCGPCRQSFPWMAEMQSKYGTRGLRVVAVNLDAKRTDAERFLAQTPANFEVVFDEKAESAKRLSIKTMPTSLLVSPEGRVLWVHSGFKKGEGSALETRIAAALASAR